VPHAGNDSHARLGTLARVTGHRTRVPPR
jgi:hypothetical protein